MIPAFGFNNTILSFYLRKRVSARASLLYSMYTIAFLGFFVFSRVLRVRRVLRVLSNLGF